MGLGGKEAPVEPKSRTMPAYDRLRLHHDQHLCPSRPEPSHGNPEQPIPSTQSRARVLALEHAYLLTQSNKLQPEVMSRAEEGGKPPEETEGKPKHPGSLPVLVIMRWGTSRGWVLSLRSLGF